MTSTVGFFTAVGLPAPADGLMLLAAFDLTAAGLDGCTLLLRAAGVASVTETLLALLAVASCPATFGAATGDLDGCSVLLRRVLLPVFAAAGLLGDVLLAARVPGLARLPAALDG